MLDSDLLSRNFNIPTLAKADYEKLADKDKMICAAFAAGVNHYLNTHPDVEPRIVKRFEPWHILAHRRQALLDWTFRKAHVAASDQKKYALSTELASNGWAIGPSKTKNGSTMLFINPHQPWFGPGSWYEAHVKAMKGSTSAVRRSIVTPCQCWAETSIWVGVIRLTNRTSPMLTD